MACIELSKLQAKKLKSNDSQWEDRNPIVMASFCTKCRWTMMVMVV